MYNNPAFPFPAEMQCHHRIRHGINRHPLPHSPTPAISATVSSDEYSASSDTNHYQPSLLFPTHDHHHLYNFRLFTPYSVLDIDISSSSPLASRREPRAIFVLFVKNECGHWNLDSSVSSLFDHRMGLSTGNAPSLDQMNMRGDYLSPCRFARTRIIHEGRSLLDFLICFNAYQVSLEFKP